MSQRVSKKGLDSTDKTNFLLKTLRWIEVEETIGTESPGKFNSISQSRKKTKEKTTFFDDFVLR